jgi:hypothetical protein
VDRWNHRAPRHRTPTLIAGDVVSVNGESVCAGVMAEHDRLRYVEFCDIYDHEPGDRKWINL